MDRQKNVRLALVLASIALVFFAGLMIKVSLFGH
ncbi:cytochrome oxidase small assembly protein [Burkholderiaceae bacterium DAT-1]|nr:cytochrome oxidase small assembly protein [Burkholderiaceae bacterium DAT-1]